MKSILKTDIKREKGKLYFLKGDPLEVYETTMGGSKK